MRIQRIFSHLLSSLSHASRRGGFLYTVVICSLAVSAVFMTASCPWFVPDESVIPSAGSIQGSAKFSQGDDHSGIFISWQRIDTASRQAVALSSESTVTDIQGNFHIHGLRPGSYTVYAVSPISAEGSISQVIEVAAGSNVTAESMILTALGSLSGQISIGEDKPEGLHSHLTVYIPDTPFSSQVGADGVFNLIGIPAFSSHNLQIRWGSRTQLLKETVYIDPGHTSLLTQIELPSMGSSTIELVVPNFFLQTGNQERHAAVVYSFDNHEYKVIGEKNIQFTENNSSSSAVSTFTLLHHAWDEINTAIYLRTTFLETPDKPDRFILLGTYSPLSSISETIHLIQLNGAVPKIQSSMVSQDLFIELRFGESNWKQYGCALLESSSERTSPSYSLWVKKGLSLSIHARTGAEPHQLSPINTLWKESLGYPLLIQQKHQYFSSQTIQPLPTGDMTVLVVWDPQDYSPSFGHGPSGFVTIRNQVENVLNYGGIQFENARMDQLPLLNLERYSALIFATEALWNIQDSTAAAITQRAADGMGIVFTCRGFSPLLAHIKGVQSLSFPPDSTENLPTRNIEFTSNWIPGLSGLRIAESASRYSFMNVDFDRQEIDPLTGEIHLLTEPGDKPPIAWRLSYGQGRVFYWNSDLTKYSPYRGLLLHSILDVLPIGLSRIANAGIFHIDDYPRPVYQVKNPPVESEYNMTDEEFYRDVMIPDLLDIASQRDMEFLFAIPFNYASTVSPSPDGWSFSEWEQTVLDTGELFGVSEAKRVRFAGHELSLHGYNHRSLLGDPENWDDENHWIRGGGSVSTMRTSVEAARNRWLSDGLGPLPVTYVAPNNKIDRTGLQVLSQAFPEIWIFASDISIDFQKGGRIDFGTDPIHPHFYSLPRWTSGFYDRPQTRLYALSQLALTGVWSHFLHPDDIYDLPPEDEPILDLYDNRSTWFRNPLQLPWGGTGSSQSHGMYHELVSLLDWSAESFPWLQWLTTIQAVDRIQRTMNTPVHLEFHPLEQRLLATIEGEPGYFWLRLSSDKELDMNQIYGAQVVWAGDSDGDYRYYVLKGKTNTISVKYK